MLMAQGSGLLGIKYKVDEKISQLESLELLNSMDSGYEQINYELASEKNYFRFLVLLVNGKYEELDQVLLENLHLIDSAKTKALFLLNLILNKHKITKMHISIREPRPEFVDDVSYELISLYQNIKSLFEFPEIDFYENLDVLPNLAIYYSDYLLTHPSSYDAAQLKEIINNDENFIKLVDDNLRAQQYRLLALYYRRQGKQAKAEAELVKYRKSFRPGSNYKLEKIPSTRAYPSAQVLEHLDEIYKEVAEIQEEVLVRSGIYQDTCFYYKCSDCCKKDFPTVSLTEFLYIKNNLSEEELDKFKAKAQTIQEQHIQQFGEPMKIVDQTTSAKENPNDFKFACPFLDEQDSCQIHGLRPLACRSFGLATINNKDVQACKLYLKQYQANSNHRGERYVYDSRETTAMIGGSNTRLAQEHGFKEMKQPVGTLVAWLSQ